VSWRFAVHLPRAAAVLAGVTVLCVVPRNIAAQAKFNAGLGAVVPIGSSADVLNPGYNAILSLTLKPAWLQNYLRLEGAVNSLTQKTSGSPKHQIASVTANLIMIGTERAGPAGYVIIGAGSYQNSGSGKRSADPGFNVGTGIRFGMGFFGTFVEARLHYVADENKTKYFPMTFGLTF
jgi:hypothetical protein